MYFQLREFWCPYGFTWRFHHACVREADNRWLHHIKWLNFGVYFNLGISKK